MRTAVFPVFLCTFLASCHASSSKTVCPVCKPDPAACESGQSLASVVKEGDGWSKLENGNWRWAQDGDAPADMSLSTPTEGSSGEMRIVLPQGSAKAAVFKVSVAYCSWGDYNWKIVADENGRPGSVVLHEWSGFLPKSKITPENGEVIWIHQTMYTPVKGPFWLIYHGVCNVCARRDAGREGLLFYRPGPQEAAAPVKHLPLVRVELMQVQ